MAAVLCLSRWEKKREGAQIPHIDIFILSLYILLSRMSHSSFQSWFPLCLLLKDRGNDSAIQVSHE